MEESLPQVDKRKYSTKWQQKPSFSLYDINAKIADTDIGPLSLSGFPITVDFENGGLKQVVTTIEQGENIFIGPPGKFSVYGIKTGDSSDGGITVIDLTMDATTGKWLVDTTAFKISYCCCTELKMIWLTKRVVVNLYFL